VFDWGETASHGHFLTGDIDMNRLIQIAREFGRDEEGATAIEYGLLAALVAVVIIGGVTLLGDQLKNTFNTVAGQLSGGAGTGGGGTQ
jgi:pilus assembly protein Flp/PilA